MSITLVGENECVVSQGEILMQEQRDIERNTGIGAIRMPVVSVVASTSKIDKGKFGRKKEDINVTFGTFVDDKIRRR